jgi:hypothetical protein
MKDPDYTTIRHTDINETWSTTENWLSATVTDSVLEPERVIVNLSAREVSEPPYLYSIRSYYWTYVSTIKIKKHYRPWKTYETHLHVIEENEFEGWWFPHYDQDGSRILDWWDKE